MTRKEKVLITVKAYPTLSGKYGELVCIAGIREDGSWIRIYPMPFRRFEEYKRFAKYTWVEILLTKNKSDPRPESYRPLGWDFNILEKVDYKDNWARRKRVVLKNNIFENMSILIEKANKNELSLATFRPAKINDFVWEKIDSVCIEKRFVFLSWNDKAISRMGEEPFPYRWNISSTKRNTEEF
jgi:hypothetical protein